jgi:hypothetical protein
MRLVSGENTEHQDQKHEPERNGEREELREKRPGLVSENRFGPLVDIFRDRITHG